MLTGSGLHGLVGNNVSRNRGRFVKTGMDMPKPVCVSFLEGFHLLPGYDRVGVSYQLRIFRVQASQ